jgi:hypothetical protein
MRAVVQRVLSASVTGFFLCPNVISALVEKSFSSEQRNRVRDLSGSDGARGHRRWYINHKPFMG